MEKSANVYGDLRDLTPLGEAVPRVHLAEPCSRNDRIAEWFDKWGNHIRGLLRTRSSVPASDVDDLTQEVFLRLLRYSDETTIKNPLGYLARVAANVANEWRDRTHMRQRHADSALTEQLSKSADEPELPLEQAQRIENIQAAVSRLPARRRDVLLSHVEHGMTCKEIALQRGLTYRIVVRDLTRAYRALRMDIKAEDL